jgi:hypothetical protein
VATKRHTTDAGKQSEPHIYQLYVELCDIAPAIWRRLQVPSWITLAKLHQVLQIAMGRTNSPLAWEGPMPARRKTLAVRRVTSTSCKPSLIHRIHGALKCCDGAAARLIRQDSI